VFRAPRLDQTTVGLNAVVGFEGVEAVESALVEQVGGGGGKACSGKEEEGERKKRKLGHVEGVGEV